VIPVTPKTKAYMESKFSDLIIDNRYLDLRRSKQLLGISKILSLEVVSKLKKYCPNFKDPTKTYLEIMLPQIYAQYGVSKNESESLGRFVDELVLSELTIFVQNLSCLPLMSRAEALRLTLDFFNISEEEYNPDSFRRYTDRYTPKALGRDFKTYRSRLTSFIINFYLEHLEKHSKNPELIKLKIEQLKFNINESSQPNRKERN